MQLVAEGKLAAEEQLVAQELLVVLGKLGPALGAQAGEARLRDVVVAGGGFGKMRRATQTPFNLVLEARL